jgi:hypothetical protein
MLKHHHFFILTAAQAPAARRLIDIGLQEGRSNHHPGQGTANRRFFVANSTLELLYIDDADEAMNGRAAKLGLLQRFQDENASPFGLIVQEEPDSDGEPFPGWRYCPEYFADDQCFQVGENYAELREPLCICMPTNLPRSATAAVIDNPDWRLTGLRIDVPLRRPSRVLRTVASCAPLSLRPDRPHHLELEFNSALQQQFRDLRPELPLTVRW